MNNTALKNAYDLCELIRCALNFEEPNVDGMDLKAIHSLAKFHSLSAISYMAIEGTEAEKSADSETVSAWKQEKEMAVRKNLLASAERKQIYAELEKMGCWYMPLKGSVLANIYPKVGMRQMADTDVLFDKNYRKDVKSLFLQRGYKNKVYGKTYDDVYQKNFYSNFEMHVDLFGISSPDNWREYYSDTEKRLLVKNGMEREFSKEDFYIYFLAHGSKHFSASGNGIRFLVDCYVYLKNTELNWNYVKTELEKLELLELETLANSLSHKLFETGEALTKEEETAFAFCAGSGTYGTVKIRVSKELEKIESDGTNGKSAKVKYIIRRIFPNQLWFEQNAPFFAKHKLLKPFFIIYRFFRALFVRSKMFFGEVKMLFKLSEKD